LHRSLKSCCSCIVENETSCSQLIAELCLLIPSLIPAVLSKRNLILLTGLNRISPLLSRIKRKFYEVQYHHHHHHHYHFVFIFSYKSRPLNGGLLVFQHHLHRPIANLSCFQKSAFYSSIRIFNILPCNIKYLKNERHNLKQH
jgi:hypothetical protein